MIQNMCFLLFHLASPVVVDAAFHTRVGLDAANEVARGAQQCHVEVLHRC